MKPLTFRLRHASQARSDWLLFCGSPSAVLPTNLIIGSMLCCRFAASGLKVLSQMDPWNEAMDGESRPNSKK